MAPRGRRRLPSQLRLVRGKGGQASDKCGGAWNAPEQGEHYGGAGRLLERREQTQGHYGSSWNAPERREQTHNHRGGATNKQERREWHGGARTSQGQRESVNDQYHGEGYVQERREHTRSAHVHRAEHTCNEGDGSGGTRDQRQIFQEEERDANGGHGRAGEEGGGHDEAGDRELGASNEAEGYYKWSQNRGRPARQEEQRRGG